MEGKLCSAREKVVVGIFGFDGHSCCRVGGMTMKSWTKRVRARYRRLPSLVLLL
jgi:hypothetical protein